MASESLMVTIRGYPFSCVPLSKADFSDKAAVYVILCVSEGGSWTVLDVGQSGAVGSRLDSHDRKSQWSENCPTQNIWVCVYSMSSSKYDKTDRENLEQHLRRQYTPPCGAR